MKRRSDKSIIIKALAIAKRNGFDVNAAVFTDVRTDSWLISDQKNYYNLLFDHRFAQCLFGHDLVSIDPYDEDFPDDEKEFYQVDLAKTVNEGNFPLAGLVYIEDGVEIPHWQYHLSHMVLSEDPVDYLRSYLRDIEKFAKKTEGKKK